jgi:hypothetical protein
MHALLSYLGRRLSMWVFAELIQQANVGAAETRCIPIDNPPVEAMLSLEWVHCLFSFTWWPTSAQVGSAQAGFAFGELQNRTPKPGSLRKIEPALAGPWPCSCITKKANSVED